MQSKVSLKSDTTVTAFGSVWSDEELAIIKSEDRLLPCQPYFSKMYNGEDFYTDLGKTLGMVLPPEPSWTIEEKPGTTYAVLGSDTNTLRFYQFLIRSHRVRQVLELGTYIGVSAMYMADAGARVTTVEKGDEFYEIAVRNINNNGFGSQVTPVHGDAVRFLTYAFPLKWDLIFIDCAKESYKELLELSLQRLSPYGLILVDDVFFQGDTLNDNPSSEKGAGVRRMLDYCATLEGYEKVMLPIGNGLLMIRKISG